MAVPAARWIVYLPGPRLLDLGPYMLDWSTHVGTSYNAATGAWSIVPRAGRVRLDNRDGRFTLGGPAALLTAVDAQIVRPAVLQVGADNWGWASMALPLSVPLRGDDTVEVEIHPRFVSFLRAPVAWNQPHSDNPQTVLRVAQDMAAFVGGAARRDIVSAASRAAAQQWVYGVRLNEQTMFRAFENLAWAAGSIPAETLAGSIALVAADQAVRTSDLTTPPGTPALDSSTGQTVPIHQSWVYDVAGYATTDAGTDFHVDIVIAPGTSGTLEHIYAIPDAVARITWDDTPVFSGPGVQLRWLNVVPKAANRRADGILYSYRSTATRPVTMRVTGTAYRLNEPSVISVFSTVDPGVHQPHQTPPPWNDLRTFVPVNTLLAHRGMTEITDGLLTRFVLTYPLLGGQQRIVGNMHRTAGQMVPGTAATYRLSDTSAVPLITETVTLAGAPGRATTVTVIGMSSTSPRAAGGGNPVTTTGTTYIPPTPTDLPDPDTPDPGRPEPIGFFLDAANSNPGSLWSDGTTVWVLNHPFGLTRGRVFAYVLATGARVTAREFNLDAANSSPRGLWSDGTTVWVLDRSRVFAYVLATGARVTAREFNLDAANSSPVGLWSDGTHLWVLDRHGGDLPPRPNTNPGSRVFAYVLATGARVTGREFNLSTANSSPRGLWSDGTTVWVLDRSRVFAYVLASGARVAGREFNLLTNSSPVGLWSDGTHLWVTVISDIDARTRVDVYVLPV